MTSLAHDAAYEAARLTAALRREGIGIGVDRAQAFVTGTALTGDLYWAGRLALLGRAEEIPLYDQVFRDVFGGELSVVPNAGDEALQDRLASGKGPDASDETRDVRDARWETSTIDALRRVPFGALSDDELDSYIRGLSRIRRRPPMRPSRRRRPAKHGSVDLRQTVRDMQRYGGVPVAPRYVDRGASSQPVTFLVDVSGSMRSSARALLLACATFVRAMPAVEVFTFGTRLTRVTPALRRGPLPVALDRACDLVPDREGGTRIGDSVRELLNQYGRSRTVRGAVLVVYSDGLELGDPSVLGRQMERARRSARCVVWLNPLSAAASYQPLARGMRAALPHIDVFASGHNLHLFDEAVEGALQSVRGALS